LAVFDEMAQSSNINILTLHAGQAIVGFDVQLPTAERIVLVVDDNEDVLILIQRFLTPHHYRVFTAQTAQAALELARQTRPHAITLDLMMPDQDGWDLLQALLNQPETYNTPIVVCSVLKQQKELALSLGATAFLKKPITEEGLLAVIESLEIVDN
jgi:CheY-like chemotaxis protein